MFRGGEGGGRAPDHRPKFQSITGLTCLSCHPPWAGTSPSPSLPHIINPDLVQQFLKNQSEKTLAYTPCILGNCRGYTVYMCTVWIHRTLRNCLWKTRSARELPRIYRTPIPRNPRSCLEWCEYRTVRYKTVTRPNGTCYKTVQLQNSTW